MDNRIGEMEIFVEAARQGSFADAARVLQLSPSAVSKVVTRLEARLGVRLLQRSTRALQLTAEGDLYLGQASRILADIDETERMVASGAAAVPRGRLRVSSTVGFGTRHVVPLVPDFLHRYPEVQLELSLSDGVVDLLGERTDVAIRAGLLQSSGLKARKLAESHREVVASPAYLERCGRPARPQDLRDHNCLGYNFSPALGLWPFRDPEDGKRIEIPVDGNFSANNGATVRQLTRAGLGISRIGRFHIEEDIDKGLLVPLLEDWRSGDREPIHAVFLGHAHLAMRIRAFVDFLVEHVPAKA